MGISYTSNPHTYLYPKIGGFIQAAVVGSAAIATFYVIIVDVCSQSLVAIGQGGFLGGMVVVAFAYPFIIEGHEHDLEKKTKHLQWLSISMGCLTSFFVITGYFYMIETEGLEKADIYYILRGQKTREQCIQERNLRKQSFNSVENQDSMNERKGSKLSGKMPNEDEFNPNLNYAPAPKESIEDLPGDLPNSDDMAQKIPTKKFIRVDKEDSYTEFSSGRRNQNPTIPDKK